MREKLQGLLSYVKEQLLVHVICGTVAVAVMLTLGWLLTNIKEL